MSRSIFLHTTGVLGPQTKTATAFSRGRIWHLLRQQQRDHAELPIWQRELLANKRVGECPMPTDIYNPGAGIGAVLLVAGLIWMALASVELHHAKRGRVNIKLTLEKWSYWRFSAWAILRGSRYSVDCKITSVGHPYANHCALIYGNSVENGSHPKYALQS